MKINWKIRFQNKTWVAAFVAACLAFIYQILGLFGIVPTVSREAISHVINLLLNLLVMLGVLIDPTTPEINDSERAMQYMVPGGEDKDNDNIK